MARPSASSPNLSIQPVGAWSVLPGFGFGLPLPVVHGLLSVTLSDDVPSRRLDASLARWIDVAAPTPPPALGAAAALAWRVGWWAGALQRRYRIPVPESVFVEDLGAGAGRGAVNVRIALPSVANAATDIALRWVVSHALALARTPAVPFAGAQPTVMLPEAALKPFRAPGVNDFSLALAAHRLGVPLSVAVPPRLQRLGTGRHAFLFQSTLSERSPWLGVWSTRDKAVTAQFLRQAGLPVPDHRFAADPAEAVTVARALGYPVVVKPADREQGEGVSAGLHDDAAVTEAWRLASTFSRRILVEQHVPGSTHRLTVSAGQVVRVVCRRAGGVIGDGVSTVEQLIQRTQQTIGNEAPRVRAGRLVVDDEARTLLTEHGLTPLSVLAAGQYVRLRRRDNASAGGTSTDVPLAGVHPDNLRLALRAADCLRLDLAGVDLIADDIAVSWRESVARICEVNAAPQVGSTRIPELFDAMIRDWVGDNARVPAHLIIALRVADVPASAELLTVAAGLGCNGLSTAAGLFIDQVPVSATMPNGFAAARALLNDRSVNGALCVMTADEVAASGLPLDRFDSIRVVGAGDAASADLRSRVTMIARPATGDFAS